MAIYMIDGIEVTKEAVENRRKKFPIPPPAPTDAERLDALETTTDDMILMMAELIGGE